MVRTSTPKNQGRRPHVSLRKAQEQTRRQVDEIMSEAAVQQAAMAVRQGHLSESEVLAWRQDLNNRIDVLLQHPEQNLGFVEEELAQAGKQLLRLAAQKVSQAKANAIACCCPKHQIDLTQIRFLRRNVNGRFGPMTIYRGYGWCSQCEQWHFPADHALGLQPNASASPYVQEICALLTSKMPPEQAVPVAQRLGLDLSRCLLHREAHRQGLKAQNVRTAWLAQLDTWKAIQSLGSADEGPPTQPFTLVIEIDAWNIRERDEWGRTQQILEQGDKPPSRWHWVYTGTVFRLDHCLDKGNRPVISQRGFVATREGVEPLTRQLYREAIARGLGQAQHVLIIADGAPWIWNLAQDRFKEAHQCLDLWHVEQHLWEVAHDLYGKNTPEARQWVAPLIKQVRSDQPIQVIQSLTELKQQLQHSLQKKVQKRIDYFQNNKNRMKYKEILQARKARDQGSATPKQLLQAQQPLGSGAIESTCHQYQCRFKRTGQFWTTAGDEALMCLETFWRNGRWDQLYPHAKQPSPSSSPVLN